MPVNGKEFVKLARKHVGERYVLGTLVPKDNWEWKGPWDCSEFASWLVYQVSEELYGCDNNSRSPSSADAYTGFWGRDVKAIGIKVSVDQAARTPGAFVLRAPLPGAIGHIVVSDGEGGTIEAHSSRRGVIEAELSQRTWDTGILIPGVNYEEESPVELTEPKTVVLRMTRPPMTGSIVRKVQKALLEKGFDPGPLDGSYGELTRAAVLAFQSTRGMVVDGEVGKQTARALGVDLPPNRDGA